MIISQLDDRKRKDTKDGIREAFNKLNTEKRSVNGKDCVVDIPVRTTRILNQLKTVTMIHTNDIHGSLIEDTAGEIGYPKFSTFIDKNRLTRKHVLLLDAGDMFHGRMYSNISEGKISLDLMKYVKYDAMTVGNHDFNFGFQRLLQIKEQSNFPIIAANVIDKENRRPFLPYVIKKEANLKIGIFGLATPETYFKTQKKNIKNLKFLSPIKVAKKIVKELQGKVDVIVLLSHLGELGMFNSGLLAKNVSNIDVIVDGHSHDILENGKIVKDSLITQAGESLKNIGYITLKILNGRVVYKKAEMIKRSQVKVLEEDPRAVNIINSNLKSIEPLLGKVIAKTPVYLNGDREYVRTSNTNLGVFIANAFLEETKADVVYMNAGGIRTSIKKGNITAGDIMNVMPFGNTIVVKEVKGEDILKTMEVAVREYPKKSGAFPQIAGMKIYFKPTNRNGNKIVKILIDDKPIDLQRMYKVAMTNITAEGGDQMDAFKKTPVIMDAGLCDTIVKEYLEKADVDFTKLDSNVIMVEE